MRERLEVEFFEVFNIGVSVCIGLKICEIIVGSTISCGVKSQIALYLLGYCRRLAAEQYGLAVKTVPAYYENIKLTTPEDLDVAEVFLKRLNLV